MVPFQRKDSSPFRSGYTTPLRVSDLKITKANYSKSLLTKFESKSFNEKKVLQSLELRFRKRMNIGDL